MWRGHKKTLENGDLAPDFRLEAERGGTQSLDELLSGGPVLLAFYKASCPTCQLTLPFLQRLQGGEFRVVAISQDDAATVRAFSREFDVDLPTLIDKAGDNYRASNVFGITTVPSMFLVETDKRISWAWDGFNKKQLESLAGRAGRPIFRPGEYVPEAKAG